MKRLSRMQIGKNEGVREIAKPRWGRFKEYVSVGVLATAALVGLCECSSNFVPAAHHIPKTVHDVYIIEDRYASIARQCKKISHAKTAEDVLAKAETRVNGFPFVRYKMKRTFEDLTILNDYYYFKKEGIEDNTYINLIRIGDPFFILAGILMRLDGSEKKFLIMATPPSRALSHDPEIKFTPLDFSLFAEWIKQQTGKDIRGFKLLADDNGKNVISLLAIPVDADRNPLGKFYNEQPALCITYEAGPSPRAMGATVMLIPILDNASEDELRRAICDE